LQVYTAKYHVPAARFVSGELSVLEVGGVHEIVVDPVPVCTDCTAIVKPGSYALVAPSDTMMTMPE
jgi:hypothetical protein